MLNLECHAELVEAWPKPACR